MMYRGYYIPHDRPFIIVDDKGEPFVDQTGKIITGATKQELEIDWLDNIKKVCQSGGKVLDLRTVEIKRI